MKKKAVQKVEDKPLSKKRQLAVAIAKDVIKWIKAKKLTVRTGTYVSGFVPKEELGQEIKMADQMQKHLPVIRKNCDVCAKGAIFLSYIELKNRIKFNFASDDFSVEPSDDGLILNFDNDDICPLLGGAFSESNLNLIETAFETGSGSMWYSDEQKRAYDFGCGFKRPNDRLAAICKNIVKNKGVFKP